MLMRLVKQRGFTLIELLVGIAIIGILLTQAMPTLSTWVQNVRIRNSTESILNGLQLARAHALRSNVNIEFVLTAAAPIVANIGAAAAANGTNWIVRRFQPTGIYNATCPAAEPTCDFIQGSTGQEGSANATVLAGQASFVFTPLGRLLNPPAADVNIAVSTTTAFTGRRPMNIIVAQGGQVLMCDPIFLGSRDDAGTPAQFQNNPQFCP